ncbi:BACON domain-containing protein [Abyssalbus ytuae]|uniref:BACON domain-containing protein n=1 Tax=Abyssalbus ytuae TaxID=2926907 RepID=A0A9E7D2D2_9FLAO|nr:hypothetical protein [Abyssalbus ytuae]UOB16569.1 hypothetical protein MQE35_12590 [Abyssalbus ytuae]
MPFSVNPVVLNYKKNRYSTDKDVTYKVIDIRGTIQILNKPNWLNIVLLGVNTDADPVEYTYKFSVNTSISSTLQAGTYSQEITFKYKSTPFNFTIQEKVNVVINVFNTILLNVSPSNLNFQYTIGGSVPGNSFLSITSENNWSIIKDQTWITLSKTSGSGNTSISVGVDVSGLTSGNYNGQILIDDGYNQKIVNVSLVVQGENTSDDYLIVSPESFQASETYGEIPSKLRQINIESSENYTIVSNVPWIQLSSSSGSSGISSVTATIINTEFLSIGNYNGVITVTTNYTVKTINVLLIINQAVINGIESNSFYFAEDRNKLSMSSSVPNSELYIEFETQASKFVTYNKTVPFFQGVGTAVIGLEAKNLIKENFIPVNITSGVINPVVPMSMNIKAYDKPVNSMELTLRQEFSNLQFINGRSPIDINKINYLPQSINAVKDAIVMFSFIASEPPSEITLNGDLTETIAVSLPPSLIYTAILKLSDYTLLPGNKITISCSGFSVNINIIPSEPQHTRLIFFNEWQCPECITLTGYFEKSKDTDNITTVVAREGKDYTKTIDVREPEEYTVNTGYIYSKNEIEWISNILRSKKIWLEIDGEFTEVICTTRSMSVFKTRRFLNSYNLTFEKAEI